MIVGFYSGMKDNEGVSFDMDVASIITLLATESAIPASRDDKHSTVALSTARYPDGMTRAKANAIDASAIALDVDEGWTIDAAEDAVEELMTPFVIYTTTKSTMAEHRFRIMLFLDRAVDAEEYEALWYGLAKRFNTKMDAKTRDISRISIMPRMWDGAYNDFRWCSRGILLDVDAILKHYPADVKAEPVGEASSMFFDALHAHRIDLRRQRNADVDLATLTDIHDSPIVPSKTLNEAMSSSQGGRTYKLLCAVAASALRQGYQVGVAELASISRQFSALAGRKRITDFEHKHDATNALRWAAKNAGVN